MALPFLAAAGIGSLAGGLLNMFGESEEEKRNRLKRQQIEAMLKQMERERQLAQEEKKQSDRDASNYPSDIYYYQLTTGNYSATKKLVFIK
jgi:hypothetical protein